MISIKKLNFRKVWDLFLVYGEIIIVKVSLAIFALIQSKLIGNGFEDTIFLIRNSSFELKEELILKHVYNNKLTIEKWDEKFKDELAKAKKKSMEIQ